jgi:hypothetical protein
MRVHAAPPVVLVFPPIPPPLPFLIKPFPPNLSRVSHPIMSGFLQPISKLSLGGDHGDANCLSWSRDGSVLAAAFDDGSLEARQLSQSSSQTLCHLHLNNH